MAKARNWQALGVPQQRRYARAGITPASYESGVSLKAARGHAETPERPSVAARRPQDYPKYTARAEHRQPADRLARELKAFGKAHGVPDILSKIPPKDRADFLAGWRIAHGQAKAGNPQRGRERMNKLQNDYPDLEWDGDDKGLGYYN